MENIVKDQNTMKSLPQDNPALGPDHICLPGILGCHQNLYQVDDSYIFSSKFTSFHFSALYMNDTMVVSGSAAGIVKLWDLPKLLDMPVRMIPFIGVILFVKICPDLFLFLDRDDPQDGSIIQPLRKINMKGVLHYPIKEIYQCTYTDLVIIAK